MQARNNAGCYVATAVYGAYDCPQVWTLRRFRDHTLAATWYGRILICAYYAAGPTLVRWFRRNVWFRKLWLRPLDNLDTNLQASSVESMPYQGKNW